jgi:UDPglucose 6-dehydrogenase
MRIVVVGTGYVGLVTGTCFAEAGHVVACVDRDAAKVGSLRAGRIPLYEPGLAELVERNVREGRLRFEGAVADAMDGAEIAFITVGTPAGRGGEVDLSQVFSAAEEIGKNLRGEILIVNKSTVPVGTAERITERVAQVARFPFEVAANPEFLKEGSAIEDFNRPDRIVVGVRSDRARALMAELYAPFVRTEQPILFMDTRSAELTKFATNAMLATRVSFMNEIAALCDRVGGDVDQVRKGMGLDRRIGLPFLFPGIGFGGSFFPTTVHSLVSVARLTGLDFDILRAEERINERQKRTLVDKALEHFGSLEGKVMGVWGLAFKPRTDDMREAPSITVIEGLIGNGARVKAHDPVAEGTASATFRGRVELTADPYAAAEGADALFLVTEWSQFRQPDFRRLRSIMRQPVLFDGRNVWDPEKARSAGFIYHGIGRSGGSAPASPGDT